MSVTRREFVKTAMVAAGSASASRIAHGLPPSPASSFSTDGHTVYHLRPAKVDGSREPVAIAACYDGMVLCYTASGRRLWATQTGGYFPFDLCAADIDGDGYDEALIASADGTLYALDHDGNLLWTFHRKPLLYQVTVAKLSGGECVILAGGIEQVLYELSPSGKLLRQLSTQYCIRHVRAGDIRGEGRDYVAVTLASSGYVGKLSLLLVDPLDLGVLWQKNDLGSFVTNDGRRFFSMAIVDVDGDGRQDIVLSGGWEEHGKISAFNHEGNQIWTRSDPRIPNVPYRMNLLSPVRLLREEFLIGVFANILILYNQDGSFRETLTCRYDFANGAFDSRTRTFWLGSGTSGGDDVHCLHLDRPGWRESFRQTHSVGKLARIERNMETLKEQIARFRAPIYQPETRKAEVLLLDEYNVLPPEALRPWNMQYRNVRFVSQMTRLGLKPEGIPVAPQDAVMICQKTRKGSEFWSQRTDIRQQYDLSADQIVAFVRDWESKGADFLLGAAHGGAVYMPLSTFERVLQAAPKHLWGFEFSEMEGVYQRMQDVVEKVLLPLAELCRKYGGKKIIFRNKNIFWNGTVYAPFWDHVLLDRRYKDIFVPDMEETNTRTQDLSLAGRVGLWMTGSFDKWGERIVTDNACFDRMWEWSSQQVLSHHFRHMVSRASYGADVHYNSIHQGEFSASLLPQIFPFYEMLEKGIVRIPKPDELLSISGVCLGMKTPPAPQYIAHGANGHEYNYSEDQSTPAMVFDHLDCYWAGAPIPQHDFSYYAYNLRRRMTNFLPPLPYGLVAIVPDTAKSRIGRFDKKISTDGMYFYDEHGTQHTAEEYKPKLQQALREAAMRLPLRVNGSAHWSAVRLGPAHVRITLIDPGYLDPDDHDAQIVFQHLEPVRCTDILSGANLTISSGMIAVRIPVGTLRILDVEHKRL